MVDDIEEDWALLKGITRSPVVTAPEGVEDDWDLIKGLPEWVYMAREDYGINLMCLWRLKPRGHRKGKLPGGRFEELWSIQYDTLLWAGSNYRLHDSHTTGLVYRVSARQISLTLDDAFKRLNGFREGHLKTLRAGIAQYERDIRERQASVERCKEQVEAGAKLVFNESLLATGYPQQIPTNPGK
jgi:hypothetical protein